MMINAFLSSLYASNTAPTFPVSPVGDIVLDTANIPVVSYTPSESAFYSALFADVGTPYERLCRCAQMLLVVHASSYQERIKRYDPRVAYAYLQLVWHINNAAIGDLQPAMDAAVAVVSPTSFLPDDLLYRFKQRQDVFESQATVIVHFGELAWA